MAYINVEIPKGLDKGLSKQELEELANYMDMDISVGNYRVILEILGDEVESYRLLSKLRERIDDSNKPVTIIDIYNISEELEIYRHTGEIGSLLLKYLLGWKAIKILPLIKCPLFDLSKLEHLSSFIKTPKMNIVEFERLIKVYIYSELPKNIKLSLTRCLDSKAERPYDNNEWCLLNINPVFYHMITELNHKLAGDVGMIIPIWAKGNEETYFLRNIHHYYHVKSGTHSEIRFLTDGEIFQSLGRYFYYRSREDLINRALSINPIKAFYPLSKSLLNISSNQDLIEGFTLEETFDMGIPMIMIYTEDTYHTISVEGAIHCWNSTKQLVLPHNIDYKIPQDVLEEIKLLASCYLIKDYTELVSVINTLFRKEEAIDHENKDLVERVGKLNDKNREKFRILLKKIFEASMYLRGWNGKIGKYPLSSSETKPKWDVQEKAAEHLTEAYKLLDIDPIRNLFDRLYNYEYRGGKFIRYTYTTRLSPYFHSILKGVECIRVGSKILCNTSSYYLELFFCERIEGYNHKNIDEIW